MRRHLFLLECFWQMARLDLRAWWDCRRGRHVYLEPDPAAGPIECIHCGRRSLARERERTAAALRKAWADYNAARLALAHTRAEQAVLMLDTLSILARLR